LIVLPLAITVAVGWANSGRSGPSVLRVDIIDLDQSAQATALLTQLRAINPALRLCPMDNNADDLCRLDGAPLTEPLALERVRNEWVDGLLIIPNGYGAAIAQAQPMQLPYYSTDDPALPGPVRQAVESVLQQVNGATVAARVGARFLGILAPLLTLDAVIPGDQAVEQAIYQRAERILAARPPAVRYETTKADTPQMSGIQNGFGQSIPGMGTLYVIFTVLAGTSNLLRERQQWTLQRLAALPLTKAQILGGKILGYFTLGMIQYGVVFAVGLVIGLDFGNDLLAMVLVMAAFALCMTALALLLATLVTSEGQANGLRNLLALTLAPLGGAWWPLEIVPEFMQQIGHLSPVAWAMDGFHDLIFNQGTLVDVMPEIGVLLAIALVLFGIGVRRFRVQ
jgi:ABC-2 type transport system permease protein